jgi:hypothetical protein
MFLRPPGEGQHFQSVIKLGFTPTGSPTSMTQIFPKDTVPDPDLLQRTVEACCLIDFRGSQLWSSGLFVTILTGTPRLFLYLLGSFENSTQTGYCIVSKYLHIRLVRWILQELRKEEAEGLRICAWCHSRRLVETKLDTFLEPDDDFATCRFIRGLSSYSEVAFHLDYLLTSFAPYFLASIITYLFADAKVLVMSSSFSHMSSTIFGIAHVLHPIRSDDIAIPINFVGIKNLRTIEMPGPCLIGVHSSLMDEIKKLQNQRYVIVNADVPYIAPMAIEPMPQQVKDALVEFHERVVQVVLQKDPTFPAMAIAAEMSAFWVTLLGPCLGGQTDFPQFIDTLSKVKKGFAELGPFAWKVAIGKLTDIVFKALTAPGDNLLKASMFPATFDPENVCKIPLAPASFPGVAASRGLTTSASASPIDLSPIQLKKAQSVRQGHRATAYDRRKSGP